MTGFFDSVCRSQKGKLKFIPHLSWLYVRFLYFAMLIQIAIHFNSTHTHNVYMHLSTESVIDTYRKKVRNLAIDNIDIWLLLFNCIMGREHNRITHFPLLRASRFTKQLSRQLLF